MEAGEDMKKLTRELEDSIDLKLTEARMKKLDETIDQEDSEIYSSIGSIFTPRMSDDNEYKGHNSTAHKQDYPFIQVNEHAALKDLGKYEQRKGTDLAVFMTGREVKQDVNVGQKVPESLVNLLNYDATDLLEIAKTVHVNIMKSKEEIKSM